MLNYKKENCEKNIKKQESRKKTGATVMSDASKKSLCLDAYGCIKGMWNPPLPEEETLETQEDKRKNILDYFFQNKFNESSGRIQKLLRDTYSSQRSLIISAKEHQEWDEIFQRWPFMLSQKFVYEHSEILLGKNVSQTFFKELDRCSLFIDYMYSFCAPNHQHGKSSKIIEMKEILEERKKAVENFQCEDATAKAIFPLLVLYFKEDIKKYLLLLPSVASDEEVLEAAKVQSMAPIIVVRGQSIFENPVRCSIVLYGKYAIPCDRFLDSVLVSILSFYCFALAYPKSLIASLEFIQRFFLQLNPLTESSHQQGRNRVNPKVVKLCEALSSFEQRHGRWAIT